MANTSIPTEALSPAAAARRLGIGRTKIYELIGAGTLRSFRIGKARRIRVEDIEALRETAIAAPLTDPGRFTCCCTMLPFCAWRMTPACGHSQSGYFRPRASLPEKLS